MTPLKIKSGGKKNKGGISIPHLDSKGGMVGKFSVTAHLKAIEKIDLVTENEWEVLPSHDVTVTANLKWPYSYYNVILGKLDQ